jgi:hypothetical protein
MKVYNKRLIEGVTTPAIIHNNSYFLIDMPVYEDGSIDCWERVSFDEISGKLEKSWLVTSVPEGQSIRIHGLGDFDIKTARWNYTPETFERHIKKTVESMNKELTGLYRKTAEQKKKEEKYRIWRCADGTPYKINGDFGYNIIDGFSTKMFLKRGKEYHLVNIIAFADGTFQIEKDEKITLAKIENMIKKRTLVCTPPKGVSINIGLGIIEISKSEWAMIVKPSEKLKEIIEMSARIMGKETAHERCVKLYHNYLVYPTEEARAMLRKAYEAVPEHERMYLGDMDSKDSDYIRIIFEPNKKREV